MNLENSEDSRHFPPQNKEDERLEAESEGTTGSRALFHESEEETETEDITKPSPLWREARHLEIEKPESTLDLELETPLEQMEEQEVVDDPVRMYLHEIGRVHLLTAAE
ncbi:unnamed protein product, partial [marine sediment metagenome]